jgi:hypothetical protein
MIASSPGCGCLICAYCSSGRHFAYSCLRIPSRPGHPCCSASGSHHQGPRRTPTSKSSVGYHPHQTVLTHHAPCLAHNQKALPLGRKSLGSAHASRGCASTLPANIPTVGPEHSLRDDGDHSVHACSIAKLLVEINRTTVAMAALSSGRRAIAQHHAQHCRPHRTGVQPHRRRGPSESRRAVLLKQAQDDVLLRFGC